VQLEAFLEQSALRWPRRTALVCGDRRVSYAELEAASNRLAHGLVALGIERGDRVAIHLENSVEAVVSIFGVLKAGAVFMSINPTVKAEKLRYLLDNSRAAALVLPGRKLAAIVPALVGGVSDGDGGATHLRTLILTGTPQGDSPIFAARESGQSPARKTLVAFDELLARHAADTRPPAKRAIDVDLAALVYTSGSTGNPKGVMLTHLNMVSAATSIATYLENTPEDVILSVLPLSFSYGLYQVLTAARAGGCIVLERSFAYPHAVLARLVAERATGLPLVPTMSAILLQMDLARYDLSSLRYTSSAGATLPVGHVAQLRRLMPHVRIYSMYGLTECTRASYLPPEQVDVRPGSVGRGMPNVEAYIVDERGRRAGPGEVGELVVRGSNVMRGYWDAPEDTDRRLRPGPIPGEKVLYTGDLFRADEEGYLYFVARGDDIIKSRGEKVAPKEVENVLHVLPGVAEAAVFGVDDEVLGQAVRAVVVLKPGCELARQDVLRHCAAHLEDFAVPQSVEFRTSLPKGPNGKIDKRALLAGEPAEEATV
jgi:long-chain acyl-CoA synthetase